MQQNRISMEFTPAEIEIVTNAIAALFGVLKNKKIPALSVDERKTLPKMNDGSLPFVQKGLEHMRTNSGLVPTYVEIGELQIDLGAVATLLQMENPLKQLLLIISDAIMLSGSEAYVAVLAFYQNVKLATKMKVPGAEAIYNDLKARFTKDTRRKDAE